MCAESVHTYTYRYTQTHPYWMARDGTLVAALAHSSLTPNTERPDGLDKPIPSDHPLPQQNNTEAELYQPQPGYMSTTRKWFERARMYLTIVDNQSAVRRTWWTQTVDDPLTKWILPVVFAAPGWLPKLQWFEINARFSADITIDEITTTLVLKSHVIGLYDSHVTCPSVERVAVFIPNLSTGDENSLKPLNDVHKLLDSGSAGQRLRSDNQREQNYRTFWKE